MDSEAGGWLGSPFPPTRPSRLSSGTQNEVAGLSHPSPRLANGWRVLDSGADLKMSSPHER